MAMLALRAGREGWKRSVSNVSGGGKVHLMVNGVMKNGQSGIVRTRFVRRPLPYRNATVTTARLANPPEADAIKAAEESKRKLVDSVYPTDPFWLFERRAQTQASSVSARPTRHQLPWGTRTAPPSLPEGAFQGSFVSEIPRHYTNILLAAKTKNSLTWLITSRPVWCSYFAPPNASVSP